jgi:site-specific DNA-methyltransferase (adenine-specific)
MVNNLYYGDNLDILRSQIKDESIDLIYLDPPFNSQANYNVLFRAPTGERSQAQIEAFEDTWHWNETAERAFDEVVQSSNTAAAEMLRALRTFLKENDVMAYLTMMAVRLLELHRTLKPTGSIYLHCDPTASHYLKVLMDAVFGAENFSNELIWKRTTTKNDYKQGAVNWPRVHDVLLMYHRSTRIARAARTFQQPFEAYDENTIATFYNFKDPDGRRYRLSDVTAPGQGSRGHPQYEFKGVTRYWRYSLEKMEQLDVEGRIQFRPHGGVPRLKVYLDEAPGIALGDVWTDVRGMHNLGTEMLGYPTQKPLALLERIINASSKEGDNVLDPFCGCGTAIHAAQKLGRQWIGIDITHLAISLIEKRLNDAFPGITYRVHGTPRDTDSSDASFQRAFMLISGLCSMKALYTQGVRTSISSKASTSASMAIGPYYCSTCTSVASVWGSQKVMSMARYSSMAVVSSAQACSRWPVAAYRIPRARWQWAWSGRNPSSSARARAWR